MSKKNEHSAHDLATASYPAIYVQTGNGGAVPCFVRTGKDKPRG